VDNAFNLISFASCAHHLQPNIPGSIGDLGLYFSIVAGVGIRYVGPQFSMIIGIVCTFIGYFCLYLASIKSIVHSSGFLCLYCLIAFHGCGWIDLTAVTVNVANFKKDKGSILGLMKALYGLSASIVSCVYANLFQKDLQTLLIYLAVADIFVLLPFAYFSKIVIDTDMVDPMHSQASSQSSMSDSETADNHQLKARQWMADSSDTSNQDASTISLLKSKSEYQSQSSSSMNTTSMDALLPESAILPKTKSTALSEIQHIKIRFGYVIVTALAAYVISISLLQSHHVMDYHPVYALLIVPFLVYHVCIVFEWSCCKSSVVDDASLASTTTRVHFAGTSDDLINLHSSINNSSNSMDKVNKTASGVSSNNMHTLDTMQDSLSKLSTSKTVQGHSCDSHTSKEESVQALPSSSLLSKSNTNQDVTEDDHVDDGSIRDALCTVDYIIYLGIIFSGAGSGLVIINNIGDFVISLGGAKNEQVQYVSLISVGNCLGRMLFGFLSDRFLHVLTPPAFLFVLVFLTGLGTFLISICDLASLNVYVLIIGIAYGGYWSVGPIFLTDRFGVDRFSVTYGMSNVATAMGTFILSSGLQTYVYQQHLSPGSSFCYGLHCFQLTMYTLTTLNVLAACGALWLVKRSRRLYDT
jgi:hypothetical protein